MPEALNDDSELVALSREGNREAFGQIVSRYQSLICSLAYSATGSLSQSEDLAQETFLTGWQRLEHLREPEKLRSWLCGIVRNLIRTAQRQQGREPAHGAEPLELAREAVAVEPLPVEQAISKEEEGILWRSLASLPALYREPLILFYREHQSVECVAGALELSEDAVKQRLARGRKMLHENVAAMVEGALEQTAPGKAFTLGVLAALPVLAASSATAATAGVGGAAAKATVVKAAAVAGLAGAILGPIIGLLGGVFGAWCSIKNTRSPRERQFMMRQTCFFAAYALLYSAAFFALLFPGKRLAASSPIGFGCALGLLVAAYCAGLIMLIARTNRRQRQIQVEDGTVGVLPSPPARVPSRKQQFWNVYGSLGGSTAGTLAWIVVQAVQTQEWSTALVTVLFGAAAVLVGGRAWMRRPERRFRVLLQTLAALGIFTLAVCVVHWREWTDAAGVRTTAWQGILLGAGLTACSLLIGGFVWLRQKRKRSRREGQNDFLLMVLVPLILSGVSCQQVTADKPKAELWTLPNGIRVASVYFPGSTNVAIFTYAPMGLVADGPRQAQWSHLAEHLVIRSTIPKDLGTGNAETLPDHLRLDTYGNVANWKEGLSHHRRWLQGSPFTQVALEAEKTKVKQEAELTARRLFTHKFALAAWAQGFRHGETHAALQGDIDRALLKDLQAYRDERLAVLSNVVVCVVGGVEPAQVLPTISEQLGGIQSKAKPAAAVKLQPGEREMSWDLNARHLVLTWRMPRPEADDFPAMLAAAQWLNVQFSSNAELQKMTGLAIAGADLVTREGNFFYVSASLRPGSSSEQVVDKIRQQVRNLSSPGQDSSWVSLLGQQLAGSLTKLPDPAAMKSQLPPGVTLSTVEMNIGLQWGMNEFRFGAHKPLLARRLLELKGEDVQQAASRHLLDAKCSVTSLRPVSP